MAHSNRDSNSIRASVYDVFLELGALDANSRVADWIFTDPSYVLPDPPDRVAERVRSPRDAVRFVHGTERRHAENEASVDTDVESGTRASSPKSFFSPKLIRNRSKAKSTSPPTTASSPSGDGYETDEGYSSASPNSAKSKSRVRTVFSLSSSKSTSSTTTTPSPVETSNPKALPSLPPIRERLNRTESSSSLAKAKSLFRTKRSKSPSASSPGTRTDDLQQWHELSTLTPRVFNPSADNGVPLAAPPSSFRQIISTAQAVEHEDGDDAPPRGERLSFALPRTLFHSLSITKRRVTRPPSLALVPEPEPSPRLATSLPSSPFILVSENPQTPFGMGPSTPFVFVSAIDNPTPLRSGFTERRFSDVTSMTAPLGMGIYPLSIGRTLRRSMLYNDDYAAFASDGAFSGERMRISGDRDRDGGDSSEPAFPRLSRAHSESSLRDALRTSPYDLYNQQIPRIQRGRETPFPTQPVLPQPLSMSNNRAVRAESRLATIQRYREFSEQLVELTPTPYKRFTMEHPL
ncbi:hypothetical protein C8R44DRAFT_796917 [Mycena epipterygia]|nr:hypothetical protein C8R44DRAFT_796917 [Mycena epipterygia]